jgi:hypothetical protein
MPICNREEVTVLETAEVRHCNPRILVSFVWVARRLAGLSREREFSDAVREHLLGISRVVAVLEVGQLSLSGRMLQGNQDPLLLNFDYWLA